MSRAVRPYEVPRIEHRARIDMPLVLQAASGEIK
jgi:hypothetical protein